MTRGLARLVPVTVWSYPGNGSVEDPVASKKSARLETLTDLKAIPRACVNCGSHMESVQLFCSELCKQEAKWVRYARACRDDGRIDQDDVRYAIQVRRAQILAGGYAARERHLSTALRKRIVERANGCCELCGQAGEEIDHINGNSNDEANLQLLCRRCHVEKTMQSMIRITRESHPEAWEHAERLRRRAEATVPVQFCDSPEWEKAWRSVLSERRKREQAQGTKSGTEGKQGRGRPE